MKKTMKIFLGFLVICSVFVIIQKEKNELYDYNENDEERIIEELIAEYEDNTKNFKPITVEEIYDYMKKKDEFYIYVGRVTCEWCRLFVNYLSDYTDQNDIEVYYLDSTDTDIDTKLKQFREINDIEYVPALMYYSEKKGLCKINFDITDEDFDNEKLESAILGVLQEKEINV